MADMIGAIRRGDYKNIHAILLAKDGLLILEEYFQGYTRDKPHLLRSATKSIGSVLVGIAIDHGYLRSVEEPIYRNFKDRTSVWNSWGKAVTIRSLLTMTSGFDCDDHRGQKFKCERAMHRSDDWVEFALRLPMAHLPGSHWAYNSTSLILLSDIITKSSGMSVPLFAEKYLMAPMDMDGFRWGYSPKGLAWLAGNAHMFPRDMAKFGQMCLDKGVWQNRRIVSEKWLAESTRCHSYSEYGINYGYLWWLGSQLINDKQIEAFWAQGNGGQVIFVCPAVDLVAVFTGGNFNSILEFQFAGMLINYILPAILPPGAEKKYIALNKRTIAALPGTYWCGDLKLDLLVEGVGLVGRLNGRNARILFVDSDRFVMPNPIIGNLNGIILRDDQGLPSGLLINAAFSQLRFQRSN